MKLTVADRLQLPSLFPKNGDLLTLGIVKSIEDKIRISPNEIEKLEMRINGSHYQWNTNKDFDLFVKFEKAEIDLLKSEVNKLDSGKQLTMAQYDIAKKIKDEE